MACCMACCMAFCGFLRAGEITVTSLKEYDPDGPLSACLDSQTDPTVVRVHIKESKTNPFRKGVYVNLGRMENELRPVAAISAFLVVQCREASPFFHFASGAPYPGNCLLGGCKKLSSRGALMRRSIQDIASVLGLLQHLQLQRQE